MIELEKTKSGLITMKYNGKYIHSKYDPIRESNQFVSGNLELINKDVIVLYGIGLGYHIEAIVDKMTSNSQLYVFEWNNKLVKYCKEINNKVYKYKNVTIIEKNNEFYTKLSRYLSMSGDIIIHKPSLETIKSLNETLYNLLNDYSFSKQSLANNKEIIEIQEQNYETNIKVKCNKVAEFINKFKNSNRPYVIVCSGPSLDSELNRLKGNREKFNVICVGSSLKTLMENQIRPDAVIIVDPSELVRKQFIGYENENIPLCFLATASRWAVEEYNGPKYIFNASDEDKVILRTGGTVAIPAIDIAVKCEAKSIVLLGQDLAFIGEKSHISEFEKMYDLEDDLKKTHKNKIVKGVDGNYVNTTEGYIRFKNKIELLISNNNSVRFINCSKGAFINGAEHMSFQDYINRYNV